MSEIYYILIFIIVLLSCIISWMFFYNKSKFKLIKKKHQLLIHSERINKSMLKNMPNEKWINEQTDDMRKWEKDEKYISGAKTGMLMVLNQIYNGEG